MFQYPFSEKNISVSSQRWSMGKRRENEISARQNGTVARPAGKNEFERVSFRSWKFVNLSISSQRHVRQELVNSRSHLKGTCLSTEENLRLMSVYCQVRLSSTAYLFSSCSAYAFTHFWRFLRFSLFLSRSLHERPNGIVTSFFLLSVKRAKWNWSHPSTHLIERNSGSARVRCFEMLEGN